MSKTVMVRVSERAAKEINTRVKLVNSKLGYNRESQASVVDELLFGSEGEDAKAKS